MKRGTTLGCKMDHKFPKLNFRRILKEKFKTELFCVGIFPQFHLFEAQKILLNLARTIFSGNPSQKPQNYNPLLRQVPRTYHTEVQRGRSKPELSLGVHKLLYRLLMSDFHRIGPIWSRSREVHTRVYICITYVYIYMGLNAQEK